MAPGRDIEDQFATAVKAAVEGSHRAAPPVDLPAAPPAISQPRRRRKWAVTLLLLVLAMAASVAVVALIQVRRNYVEHRRAKLAPSPSARNQTPAPQHLMAMESSMGASEFSPAAVAVSGSSPAANIGASPTAALNTPVVGGAASSAAPEASASALTVSVGAGRGKAAKIPNARVTTPTDASQSPSSVASPAANLSSSSEQIGASEKTVGSVQHHRSSQASAAATPPPYIAHDSKHAPIPQAIASGSNSLEEVASSPTPDTKRLAAVEPLDTSSSSNESQTLSPEDTPPKRPIMISSPDHSVYWALEPSGTILRSVEGKAWQPQDSGVQVDLLAGEAPTDNVCWVVGRKGTILLTTDGAHWDHVKSPLSVDIVRVTALSADVADIVGADGSRYSTFDRGSNWMPSD